MLKFFGIISALALVGCVSKQEDSKVSAIQIRPASMIQYQMLYTDLERELSFPYWFNDSLIAINKIRSVTRSVFKNMGDQTIADTANSVPSEQWTYVFRKNGTIERVYHRTYYDDRLISLYVFRYPNENPAGYMRSVLMDSMVRFEENENAPTNIEREEAMYRIYQLKNDKGEFQSYQNTKSTDLLYLITSSSLRNPLDIGKMLNPSPMDRIVFGIFPCPDKIYSVEGRVKEKNVRNFVYENQSIVRIDKSDFPFQSSKTFLYDLNGRCTGYIDSLKSDKTFLTRTQTQFYLNQMNAPNTVLQLKQRTDGKEVNLSIENFQYELYP